MIPPTVGKLKRATDSRAADETPAVIDDDEVDDAAGDA